MSNITRDNPYSDVYNFYGDPEKLVEYRLFVLNECAMDCKGCFYNRINNDFNDFSGALQLAEDMFANGYRLETCYLLPTDIFDNKDNYLLFDNPDFRTLVGMFSFLGIATTLENDYDKRFFDIIYTLYPNITVEMQVNLSIKRLFDINYQMQLEQNIRRLKYLYDKQIVINLAINTGFDLTDKERTKLKSMIYELSEDGIVELNFTFLYNDTISLDNKKRMLRKAIGTVNEFGKHYQEHPSFVKQYNERTFQKKPSFAFVGSPNRIYVNPIVPFDEYVFVEDETYLLDKPIYESFIECYSRSTVINSPILNKCEECDNLEYCMGKHYFAIANHFELGCFMDEN